MGLQRANQEREGHYWYWLANSHFLWLKKVFQVRPLHWTESLSETDP
jgi:hypothetical protein